MVIIHVSCFGNYKFSGIYSVVPKYVVEQQKKETVAFLNIKNTKVPNIKTQILYTKEFSFEKLVPPFNKPDIVVFHEVYCIDYLKMAKQLVSLKIPYVIVPHSSLTKAAQKKKAFKKTVANICLFNSFLKNASGIQFLSQNEMDCSLFNKKGFICFNGIMTPRLNKGSFNDTPKQITYIGRLDMKIKGLDLLVKAVSKSKDSFYKNNVLINIYGPDLHNRLKKLVRLIQKHNLTSIIKVNPPVIGDEKEKVLLASDVFIQTSRSEGMPMGILEAMSYGIPCFVTKGTNMASFISKYNCGWIAENDVDCISKQLLLCISQHNIGELGNRARICTKEVFSWGIITLDTLNNYKRIVLENDR